LAHAHAEAALVEIPEHLLKRSQERRAALGLGGGEATPEAGASESAATPVAAAPSAPAPAPKAPPPEPKAPEPPKPDPLYIQAAKQRGRLPWWSIPVFAALPLWGWVFVNTLTPVDHEVDPIAGGASLYTSCSNCHGTDGMTVASAQFDELTEDFPDFRDQMMWVRVGTDGWLGDTYGATEKEVGGGGQMPAHADLTDMELAQVVMHERTTFAEVEIPETEEEGEEIGQTPDGEPVTDWHLMQIASGELTWAEIGLGELSAEAGFEQTELDAVETGGGEDAGH
jgi:mono/diheme cytochrome c family protein